MDLEDFKSETKEDDKIEDKVEPSNQSKCHSEASSHNEQINIENSIPYREQEILPSHFVANFEEGNSKTKVITETKFEESAKNETWESSQLLSKLSKHMMTVEKNSVIIRQNLLSTFGQHVGAHFKKETWQ